ncbi:DUF7661 family protein [Achromobacter pestifer]
MKFDIYGRFQLDIEREGNSWAVYRSNLGKRVRSTDIAVPAEIAAGELSDYLDDIYHELSPPGGKIIRLE